jgi:CO dehydrogenase maturation factor
MKTGIKFIGGNFDRKMPLMKIAFVGKGGVGKTTLASLFARHLAAQGRSVLALDADINQSLAAAVGEDVCEGALPTTLGAYVDEIKEYLRGTDPRISSSAAMVKTTTPVGARGCCGWWRTTPIWAR